MGCGEFGLGEGWRLRLAGMAAVVRLSIWQLLPEGHILLEAKEMLKPESWSDLTENHHHRREQPGFSMFDRGNDIAQCSL